MADSPTPSPSPSPSPSGPGAGPSPRSSALIPALTSPVTPGRSLAVLAAATGLVFTAGAVTARVMSPAARPAADSCALPAGLDGGALGAADQGYLIRRSYLCRDVAAGRMSQADYRAAVALLDRPAPAPLIIAPLPAVVWASTVRDKSTQWSDGQWSAQRVLGPPDVFPSHGDNVNAWASSGADDRVEFLEVGLEHPTRLSAVEIFETYNPGSVSAVELIGADGARRTVYQGAAAPLGDTSHKQRVELGRCTDEPVVAIRVTLDSPAVPGWNEIDAIGGVPCR